MPRDDGRLSRGWSDNFVPALAPPDRMLEAGVPGCSRASCDSWYSRRAYASFRPLMQPGAVVTRKTAICRGQAFSLSTTHEARASPRSQLPNQLSMSLILLRIRCGDRRYSCSWHRGASRAPSLQPSNFHLNRQVLPAAGPVAISSQPTSLSQWHLRVYSHVVTRSTRCSSLFTRTAYQRHILVILLECVVTLLQNSRDGMCYLVFCLLQSSLTFYSVPQCRDWASKPPVHAHHEAE